MPVLEINIQESSVLVKKIQDEGIEFSIAVRDIDGGQFKKLVNQFLIRPPRGMISLREFCIFASLEGISRMVICTIKDGAK